VKGLYKLKFVFDWSVMKVIQSTKQ